VRVSFLQANDRILVTGGAGFLGKHLLRKLAEHGYTNIVAPRSVDYDLREQSDVRRLLADLTPSMIIHLAASVGGIGANRANPGKFLYENLIMGALLIEESRKAAVQKFVTIGTICSYPKFSPIPFKESDLWNGYPEETNAPYGLAKKLLLVQGQTYSQQYNFDVIHLMPVNLYGPGDNFDPDSSHVIPAMIKKCFDAIEAGESEIVLWGDGSPTREFIFVTDVAEAIILAAEKYSSEEPINIGSGLEISIKELAELITELCNFPGKIRWDSSFPNGQPRRRLDIERARKAIGFEASTDFKSGLKATIEWYRQTRTAPARLHSTDHA